MSTPPPNARWYDVPAGTRVAECSGKNCGAEIYWIATPNGKKMPIDCDVDGGAEPSDTSDEPGRGVSHFQTCADADRFSGRNRS